MPHRDADLRRLSTLSWKDVHRPVVGIQTGDLPPIGAVRFSPDGQRVQCHECGRWFRTLNTHIKTHGLSYSDYREAYGLARTLSLWPPATQAKQREAALARGLDKTAVAHLPPAKGRPVGQTTRLSSRVASSAVRKGKAPR